MKSILPILWDIFKYNVPMVAVFFALLIGFWAVQTNLLEALSGTAGNGSITAGTWSFVIFWIFYFALVVWKARERHLESAKKAEMDLKEAQNAQKKFEEEQAFKDEVNNKLTKLSSEVDKLQKAQASTSSNIISNMANLYTSIEILDNKTNATHVAIDEIKKDNKWFQHLSQFYHHLFSKKEKKSLRQAQSISSISSL